MSGEKITYEPHRINFQKKMVRVFCHYWVIVETSECGEWYHIRPKSRLGNRGVKTNTTRKYNDAWVIKKDWDKGPEGINIYYQVKEKCDTNVTTVKSLSQEQPLSTETARSACLALHSQPCVQETIPTVNTKLSMELPIVLTAEKQCVLSANAMIVARLAESRDI